MHSLIFCWEEGGWAFCSWAAGSPKTFSLSLFKFFFFSVQCPSLQEASPVTPRVDGSVCNVSLSPESGEASLPRGSGGGPLLPKSMSLPTPCKAPAQ